MTEYLCLRFQVYEAHHGNSNTGCVAGIKQDDARAQLTGDSFFPHSGLCERVLADLNA